MMAFITHCWRKARLDVAVLLACIMVAGNVPVPARADATGPEVAQLKVERGNNGLHLTSTVSFELPTAVEDALLKGVAVFFVAEAEVYRERWYWMDKKVASATRHMRLVYQPLTQRWRLGVSGAAIANNGLGVTLNQTFDSLEDALNAVRRISGWRIAEATELEAGARHRVEFVFKLDVSQLPRPLQIGALGQNAWTLSMAAVRPLTAENGK